jgi:hypothetical protein
MADTGSAIHPQQLTVQRPTIPTEWTAFRSCDLPSAEAVWTDYDAPVELTLIPGTINIPQKLADIVQWSLHRPDAVDLTEPLTPTHTSSNQSNSSLLTIKPPKPEDRAENNSIASSPHSRTPSILENAVPKLRHVQNELVASALSKFAALKAKHSRDRVASTKITRELSLSKEKPVTGECTSCFDDFPVTTLVGLPCTHKYCKPCLTTLIMTALQTESAFPPKCCLSEIPIATIIIPLDKKQQELYKAKAAEYSIPASRRW